MFKIIFRRMHLALALLSGVFLINLSISGALLLYAKDIQALVNPQYWQVTLQPNLANKPLALATLVDKVSQHTKQAIKLIERSDNATDVWQIRLTNKQYLNINPYNGEVLLQHNFYDTFHGFVMAWHRWLLYRDDQGNRPMHLWISIASFVLIFELVIGLLLWLKPKHRLKRLKVRWQAKNKVRFHQLHGVIGIFCIVPLILIAFSGMAFYWQDATKTIVEVITADNIAKSPTAPRIVSEKSASNSSQKIDLAQLDLAYENARTALSEGQVYRIYLPQKSTEPLALRIKMPEESHAYSWSWANPASGDYLAHFDASKLSRANKVWHFKYKFHIGEFIAWPIKVLWLLLSLVPGFFVISGVYLWWQRQRPLKMLNKSRK